MSRDTGGTVSSFIPHRIPPQATLKGLPLSCSVLWDRHGPFGVREKMTEGPLLAFYTNICTWAGERGLLVPSKSHSLIRDCGPRVKFNHSPAYGEILQLLSFHLGHKKITFFLIHSTRHAEDIKLSQGSSSPTSECYSYAPTEAFPGRMPPLLKNYGPNALG